MTRAADDLVADQTQPFGAVGSFWGEEGLTGESVVGLVRAYQLLGQSAYKDAALAGGTYCLFDEGGYNSGTGTFGAGLYASGAYALSRLSAIADDPQSNLWRTALIQDMGERNAATDVQWYRDNSGPLAGSTLDDSWAVYDLARLTVAAHSVDDPDKLIWRNGLLDALSDVDGADDAPVMALGAAVWALGRTGPIAGDEREVWSGVEVEELSDVLADLQVADDPPNLDGSFYTMFKEPGGGHPLDQSSGFTETTAVAALGLIGASQQFYADEIAAARLALAQAVDTDPNGQVYWEMGNSGGSPAGYYLAGETLETILDSILPGDANLDGSVDDDDLSILLANWGATTDWMHGNFGGDGTVNDDDLSLLLANWSPGGGGGVPEPTTLAALAIGTLLLRSRRCRTV
jgi:hypothetical protein